MACRCNFSIFSRLKREFSALKTPFFFSHVSHQLVLEWVHAGNSFVEHCVPGTVVVLEVYPCAGRRLALCSGML